MKRSVVLQNLDFAFRQNTTTINLVSTSQLQLSQIALVALLQQLIHQHRHTFVTFPFLMLPDDSRAALNSTVT